MLDDNGATLFFYAELAGNSVLSDYLMRLAGHSLKMTDKEGRTVDEWVEAQDAVRNSIKESFDPELIFASIRVEDDEDSDISGISFHTDEQYVCEETMHIIGCVVVCYVGSNIIGFGVIGMLALWVGL